MLGNCDKIITPLSSTTNQWPQNQIILDDHKSSMASSSTAANINKAAALMAAEKTNTNPNPNPNQQQQQQEHPHNLHPLKCPRCDSSNTKFCYYNNYSLSQPRHFCKACKRYWTRGGTLRNVPVGGGCRKNKRHKRHSSDSNSNSNSLSSNSHSNSHSLSSNPQIDLPPPSNHTPAPLFYGNPLELNFPFSSFRVSSDDSAAFDQISALGLGFSSNAYKNGFKPIQDASSSPFSAAALPNNHNNNNNSIFFGSSSFSTASTMASLLASTQKFGAPGLMPDYEDPRMPGTGKQQVKAEGENNNNSSSRQLAAAWNPNPNPNQSPNLNPIDQMNSSDPSSLVWNTSSIGGWFDPSSMGSSVPSLI